MSAAAWKTTSGRYAAKTSSIRSRVADVGHDEVGVVEECPALERQLHGVQGGLVAIQHDQLGRCEAMDLPAQLAADRTTGAGDEHAPAGDIVGHGVHVGVDLVSPQEVHLGHRADVADPDGITEELVDRRQDPRAEPDGIGPARHLADQLAAGRGDGHDQHGGPVLVRDGLEVVARPPNAERPGASGSDGRDHRRAPRPACRGCPDWSAWR